MLKISIVIPIFRVENYIASCLDSIFLQERMDTEIECILVDDCSPDNSMKVVSRVIENYSGKIVFKILSHKKNAGPSRARNSGISLATGDFLFFMDSDDRLLPGAFDSLLGAFMNSQDNNLIDVVIGNTYICGDNIPAMDIKESRVLLVDNSNEAGLRKLLTREFFHTPWNKLIRRDFLEKNSIYFEDGIIDEDLLWAYLLFYNARKVLVIPQITYIYEDHPGSIMNTVSERVYNVINSRIVVCERILENPPQESFLEFYSYILFILSRAVNLFEKNKQTMSELSVGLYSLRERLLMEIRKHKYYLLYLHSLSLVKPFYYVNKFWFYRRYFDRITKIVILLSRLFSKAKVNKPLIIL